MVLPCTKSLALPVSLGLRGSVLRHLLTSSRIACSLLRATRPFGQALLAGTHGGFSPDKNVICLRPSATSTCTPSSGSVSRCQARSPGATGLKCGFCTSPGGSWRECCRLRRRSSIRRLPLHGLLPRRSCPRLVLISYELSIWYDDSQRKYRNKTQGTFTP